MSMQYHPSDFTDYFLPLCLNGNKSVKSADDVLGRDKNESTLYTFLQMLE